MVEELFGVDFSRCYLATEILLSRDLEVVIPSLLKNLNRAKKDYGALYFFISLLGSIALKSCSLHKEIEDLCLSALSKNWPNFMKFRPIAIYTLMEVFADKYLEEVPIWLNPIETPFWASRYSCLLSIQDKLERKEIKYHPQIMFRSDNDPHRFVKAKSCSISYKYSF